jgi:hypothetical protein
MALICRNEIRRTAALAEVRRRREMTITAVRILRNELVAGL